MIMPVIMQLTNALLYNNIDSGVRVNILVTDHETYDK